MNGQEPPARDPDRLLREVAVGDRPADDADVRAVAAEDPAFREDLERIRTVTDRLESAARLETEVLRRADELRGVSGESSVRRALMRATRRADRRFGRFVLMAAALVIAVSGIIAIDSVLRSRNGSGLDIPEGPYMGGELRPTAPVGEVESFDEFRWHDPDGPKSGDTYVVEIYPEGERGAALATSEPLEDTVWNPTREERTGWPVRIDWIVTRHRMEEASMRSASVSAQLSR